MQIHTESLSVRVGSSGHLDAIATGCSAMSGRPVRAVVAHLEGETMQLEVDVVTGESAMPLDQRPDIFNLRKRQREAVDAFTACLVIPTGVGCELGGHEGDANAVARLLGSACDTLVTHPNVVNAADYNEMPPNTLYVEGSSLSRLLMGQLGLQPVRTNRILTLVDAGPRDHVAEIINAVSTARVTLGLDADVRVMSGIAECEVSLTGSGRASGTVTNLDLLFEEIATHAGAYDALALSTHIGRDLPAYHDYFSLDRDNRDVIVNPTGGLEAMMTHAVVEHFTKPCAHAPAPQVSGRRRERGVYEPRIAPAVSSLRDIHCVLKGLQRSPKLVAYEHGLNAEAISCLIIPEGCIGLPVLACLEQEIPVIAVRNRNVFRHSLAALPFGHGMLFFADNYLEAVGLMQMLKEGIALDSVSRPIAATTVL